MMKLSTERVSTMKFPVSVRTVVGFLIPPDILMFF
jgi:hypothetical protein